MRVLTVVASIILFVACQHPNMQPRSQTNDLSASSPEFTRPNIILFLVDDMGLMDMSVPMLVDKNGEAKPHPLNSFYRTPNLEKLADNGVRFTQFYAHSVCSPTRVSIFTGQNSARHKTTQWIHPLHNNSGNYGPKDWNWNGLTKENATLLTMLNEAGYQTIHVGKGHFAPAQAEGANPINIGFDENIGGAAHGAPGSYYGEEAYGKKKNKNIVPHLEAYHNTDTFLTEALTLEANKAIARAAEKNTPFFLYMSHYAVHTPFYSDPRFISNYDNTHKSEIAKTYASMVEGIDHSMGQLLEQLEQLNIAEDTLVIFLGDNGSTAPLSENKDLRFEPYTHASSAPLRGMKGTSYEGGMRVPFIASWAKPVPDNKNQQRLPIAQGKTITQIGSILDILPTLQTISAPDFSIQTTVDGDVLSKQFAGQFNHSRRQTFLNHFPHVHRSSYFTSYVNGDWKLVYFYPLKETFKVLDPLRHHGHSECRLFNLKDDPYEKYDLSKSHHKELKQMMRAMQAELDSMNALYPLKDDTVLLPSLACL
ncbi:sulfatase-like hydrolase/transferase [Agaribacter flavus]|uniref:Sulfatase-like hydrolase/transferase n=1 Tax=Agaribacter flavus TaxID=1902781 RepID=A0ABV7FRH5_9ALTE